MPWQYEEIKLDAKNPDNMLRRTWTALQRLLRTQVEHGLFTNGSGGAITRGQCLAMNGDLTVTLSDASVAADASLSRFIGVVNEETVDDGDVVRVATDNVRLVRLETDLTPDFGEEVYLSSTVPGSATNVAPSDADEKIRKIGVIADARTYSSPDDLLVWVLLHRCCMTTPGPIG